MSIPSDLEIARSVVPAPLGRIAHAAGIDPELLEPYGRHVAKIPLDATRASAEAKYIVVTAVTPTPLGEGKTTTAVGLAQGLARIGKRATLTLRQPSLGPTFGIKGGAAGGGYSQVIPMEQMNLHLTGDFHAVTAAHNLLAALLDNHLHQGNRLGIDPRTITWPRVIDVNDRALRHTIVGLGGINHGVPREASFDITAASEVMVILAMSTTLDDLRARLGRIVVGLTNDRQPVTADQLHAAGAMAVLLKDAIKPNLLQTLEHTPVLVHAGPFGNIATGASSIIADEIAMGMGEYVITEAGFGADMGAERFVNVKCRASGRHPDAAVIVVTVRSLKMHSGRFRIVPGRPLPAALLDENPDDVRAGATNLRAHIRIVQSFGITPVVAINVFATDTASEIAVIEAIAAECGARVTTTHHVTRGGDGAVELAALVAAACEESAELRFTYDLDASIEAKITAIATKVYGADGIRFDPEAERFLAWYRGQGFPNLPVVIAKTHLSLSADAALKGAPRGWTLPVRELRLAAGAGYVYAICGTMTTMPAFSAHPAAERLDLDANGDVIGLS